MKNSGALLQKLKQLKFRYRKAYIDKYLKRCPQNCCFNHQEVFRSGKKVGLCRFRPEEGSLWEVVLCDEETTEGLKQANSCLHFSSRKSLEELNEEFRKFLVSSTIGQIAYHYKDVAALMWVLEIRGGEWALEEEEESAPSFSKEEESLSERG